MRSVFGTRLIRTHGQPIDLFKSQAHSCANVCPQYVSYPLCCGFHGQNVLLTCALSLVCPSLLSLSFSFLFLALCLVFHSSFLSLLLFSLYSHRATHIPYRDSKLTRLLEDSLGGNTKTVRKRAHHQHSCTRAMSNDFTVSSSVQAKRIRLLFPSARHIPCP